jgi:hypothetical protein
MLLESVSGVNGGEGEGHCTLSRYSVVLRDAVLRQMPVLASRVLHWAHQT